MALLISHRGNTQGIDESRENTQEYIQSALDDKYHVVVDVFLIGNAHLALGIDSPTHPTNLAFLQQPLVIARAHSIACLDFLLSNQVHCFLHTNDTSLTSGGLIWTSHTSHLTSRCIYAMPEWTHSEIIGFKDTPCAGICSNFIQHLRNARQYDIDLIEKLGSAATLIQKKWRKYILDNLEAIL